MGSSFNEFLQYTLQSFWHRNSRTRLGHNYRNEYQDSINKSVITRIYRGIFGNIQNWLVQFHFIPVNMVFVFKHYVKHFLSIPEPWFGILQSNVLCELYPGKYGNQFGKIQKWFRNGSGMGRNTLQCSIRLFKQRTYTECSVSEKN